MPSCPKVTHTANRIGLTCQSDRDSIPILASSLVLTLSDFHLCASRNAGTISMHAINKGNGV